MSLDVLFSSLRARPGSSALELAGALHVSVPTVRRLLRAAGDGVVTQGRARRTLPAGDDGALKCLVAAGVPAACSEIVMAGGARSWKSSASMATAAGVAVRW